MLKSIFISFVLITSLYSMGDAVDGTDATPPSQKRRQHNPYATGVVLSIVPSPDVIRKPEPKRALAIITQKADVAESKPAVVATSAVLPVAVTVTRPDAILALIRHKISNLGHARYSQELVDEYKALIQECEQKSHDPALESIRLNVLNCKAYTLLGLSNVYGKLRDNLNKLRTANHAFSLYVSLSQSDFVLNDENNPQYKYRESPRYKAGTCLSAMSVALYYMSLYSGRDIALGEYENVCLLIEAHVVDDEARQRLLESFGVYETTEYSIITGITLRSIC